MKLSIYLLATGFQEGQNPLRAKYQHAAGGYDVLTPRDVLSFPCIAYVQRDREKVPKWLEFLQEAFDINEFTNSSNSVVLVLKSAGRYFAVAFGYGFTALNLDLIEPRFGIRTTLNTVDPNRLRTLDSTNVDLVTRQRRTHLNAGRSLGEFGLSEHLDWLKFVSGTPSSADLAKTIGGADSVQISQDVSLIALGQKCADLLAAHESEHYKEHFPFIDYLAPLRKGDGRIVRLNDKARAALRARDATKLALAFHEVPESNLASIRLILPTEKRDLGELAVDGLFRFLDDQNPADPFDIGVILFDANGDPISSRRSLRDYLVFETELEKENFVLSLGQWFKVDPDYIATLRTQAGRLSDVTDHLSMPTADDGEREDVYNARVAQSKGWLLLDRNNYQFPESRDKVEIADLLTEDGDFICVKKMSSSATLSHLFAQGSVSAQLLRSLAAYKHRVESDARARWPSFSTEQAGEVPRFVYAIQTKKGGTLPSSMFTFSLINLMEHVRTIQGTGFRVAICRIGYTGG